MIDLFWSLLPYWWAAPLAGVAYLAYRLLGWRGLVAVLTLGAAGGLYTKGRTDERAKTELEAEGRRSRAIEERARVNDEVAGLDPDTKRNRLNDWMRDD